MRAKHFIGNTRVSRVLLLCGLLIGPGGPAWAATSYTITSLGNITPAGLNDLGWVVGYRGSGDTSVAVLFAPGGQPQPVSWPLTQALGINDAGQAVGTSKATTDPWQPALAEDWALGFQALPTLGGAWGSARRINEAGWVVGSAHTTAGKTHAFLNTGTGPVDLGTLCPASIPECVNAESRALDINKDGLVVGYSTRFTSQGNVYRAFIHDDAAGMREVVLGTGTHRNEYGWDINSGAVLVGVEAEESWFTYRAFVYDWANQSWHYLASARTDVIRSYARAINDGGLVVGHDLDTQGKQYAALWQDGQVFDLNDLLVDGAGWAVREAYDINNQGLIIGVGEHNGATEAFLLSPVSEAGTWAMLLAGLGLIGLRLHTSSRARRGELSDQSMPGADSLGIVHFHPTEWSTS